MNKNILIRRGMVDRRNSQRFEVPLFIREPDGKLVQRYGKISISGFYFETNEIPIVGQTIEVLVVLSGLGMEIATRGKVTKIFLRRNHVGVAVSFDEIPFETERMIARWLDLLTNAYQEAIPA
jgi:hypothetical protein